MNTTNTTKLYIVKNVRTGQVIKTLANRDAAYRMVDRLDRNYGACIHGVFFA